jgi:protein ImuB
MKWLAIYLPEHTNRNHSVQTQSTINVLACWAYRFTPFVTIKTVPHVAGVLLEIAGSLNLFGGYDALMRTIHTGLNELTESATTAVAVGPTAAWWLAKHQTQVLTQSKPYLLQHTEQLGLLPITVMDSAQHQLKAFEGTGLERIKDILDLPRDTIARRFGQALLNEIDSAYQRRAETHTWFIPPEVFSRSADMPFHSSQIESLLRLAESLLIELKHFLFAKKVCTKELKLTCRHNRDQAPSMRIIRSNRLLRNEKDWLLLVQHQLQPHPIEYEVSQLDVYVDTFFAEPNHSYQLFPELKNSEEENLSWATLVDGLSARLGTNMITILEEHADARPEKAQYTHPALEFNSSKTTRKTPLPQVYTPASVPKPLWLLSPPIRLVTKKNKPYRTGELRLLCGPERIESGWWDGAPIRRDYYIAQDEDLTQLWIYCELSTDSINSKRWFLHGLFA